MTSFLLLAFGISWTGFIGAWALGFDVANPLVQLPMACSPAFAAFVVRRWVTREGFADAGLRPRLRPNLRHYLAAWLAPYALAAVGLALAAAFGGWRPDLGALVERAIWLPALLVAVPLLTVVYWGEEFGWTAYLRMRLFPGRPWAATLATGSIWAVWHYPLAFVGYIEFGNVVAGLAAWTLMFVAMEVLLSWIWLCSGSIWTASLAHAGNNLVISLLLELALTTGEAGLGATTRTLLTAAAMSLPAVAILLSTLRGQGHGLARRGPGACAPEAHHARSPRRGPRS